MSILLSEQLTSFSENDYAVRAVRGLLGVLPFVPNWRHPGTLEEAAARLDPALTDRVVVRAERLAMEPGPQAALKTFELLDKGDKGLALFSGIRSAVQAARRVEGALETDPQQAADAGLKALGLSYAGWKLFPGETAKDRMNAMLDTDAGKALLIFYVAVDVILPFADNVASGGLELMSGVIERYATENAQRLVPVAGSEVQEAVGMLQELAGTLRGFAGQASSFARPLSEWCREKLPGMLGKVDALGGMVATGVDALATYRYLGAAMVAEVCLRQALMEVRAEVAAEPPIPQAPIRLAKRSDPAPPPLPAPAPAPDPAPAGGFSMGMVGCLVIGALGLGIAAILSFLMFSPGGTTGPVTAPPQTVAPQTVAPPPPPSPSPTVAPIPASDPRPNRPNRPKRPQ